MTPWTAANFPGGSDGEKSTCNAGDPDLVPALGKAPAEGNSNPLPYSCLENSWTEEPSRLQSMDHKELDATERLTLHRTGML